MVMSLLIELPDLSRVTPGIQLGELDFKIDGGRSELTHNDDPYAISIRYIDQVYLRVPFFPNQPPALIYLPTNATTHLQPASNRALLNSIYVPAIPSIPIPESVAYLDWAITFRSAELFGGDEFSKQPTFLSLSNLGNHWFVFNQTTSTDSLNCSINGVPVIATPLFTSKSQISQNPQNNPNHAPNHTLPNEDSKQSHLLIEISDSVWSSLLPYQNLLPPDLYTLNCYNSVLLASSVNISDPTTNDDWIGAIQVMISVDPTIEQLGKFFRCYYTTPTRQPYHLRPAMISETELTPVLPGDIFHDSKQGNCSNIGDVSEQNSPTRPSTSITIPPNTNSAPDYNNHRGYILATWPVRFEITNNETDFDNKKDFFLLFIPHLSVSSIDAYITIETPNRSFKYHTITRITGTSLSPSVGESEPIYLPKIFDQNNNTQNIPNGSYFNLIITAMIKAKLYNTDSPSLTQVYLQFNHKTDTIDAYNPILLPSRIPYTELLHERLLAEHKLRLSATTHPALFPRHVPDSNVDTSQFQMIGYDFFILNTKHPHFYFTSINNRHPIQHITIHLSGRWEFSELNQEVKKNWLPILNRSIRCNYGKISCFVVRFNASPRAISFELYMPLKDETKLNAVINGVHYQGSIDPNVVEQSTFFGTIFNPLSSLFFPDPNFIAQSDNLSAPQLDKITHVELNIRLLSYTFTPFISSPDSNMTNDNDPDLNLDHLFVSAYISGQPDLTPQQEKSSFGYLVPFLYDQDQLPFSGLGSNFANNNPSLTIAQIFLFVSGGVVLLGILTVVILYCSRNGTTCLQYCICSCCPVARGSHQDGPNTDSFDPNQNTIFPLFPKKKTLSLNSSYHESLLLDHDSESLFQDALDHIDGNGRRDGDDGDDGDDDDDDDDDDGSIYEPSHSASHLHNSPSKTNKGDKYGLVTTIGEMASAQMR
jgi:hypothetical protein